MTPGEPVLCWTITSARTEHMGDGPSCSLHLSTLDSLDYWTDEAMMPVMHPTSSMEWERWNRLRLEKHVYQMLKKTKMRRSID